MAKKAASTTPSSVGKVLEMLKEHSVEYVDLRFTDPRGKWQHTAQHISTIDEDVFRDGFMFDGSSIAGWKAINESDMILMPDPDTAVMDPFAAKPSLILICDIIEPSTGQLYSRDPRGTAKKAEAYVKSSGIGDGVFFGPEAEFFIFDSVKFGTGGNYGTYQVDSVEGPGSSMKDYPEGNMGHRPAVKGGYFPVPPVDGDSDLRAEMLTTMGEMGLPIEKHHHEVAQSQHELGTKFASLVSMADQMQIYKYCVHNVAASYGK
ncbi:MAG: glutamine synthetase beta-grasp domain-containing protein, partial [Rhodospirillales bacterium]|nr:glutamine synthetase beta-grasp domain-containing protein [Rhodospirillales bacterium]